MLMGRAAAWPQRLAADGQNRSFRASTGDDAPATKLDKLEASFMAGKSVAETTAGRRVVAAAELSRYPALALSPRVQDNGRLKIRRSTRSTAMNSGATSSSSSYLFMFISFKSAERVAYMFSNVSWSACARC